MRTRRLKKKKFWVRPRHVHDTVATCQVCPRHGIAWKKFWFLHLDHYRPSIKLKSFSLSLTLSASLSCFPLGLPSCISLQHRLATNGAPLTSMSPKLHRLVSISLAPSVPESGAWPRFSLLSFLFLFFCFLRLGSLSLLFLFLFLFLIRVLVFSLAFYFRCDLLFSICSCDLFFLVYLFVLLFSLAFVVTYFICCDLLAGCEQFVYLVFI